MLDWLKFTSTESELNDLYRPLAQDPYWHVDVGVRPLVRAMNKIPGIVTYSSCSGHPGLEGEVFDGYDIESDYCASIRKKMGLTIKYGIEPQVAFQAGRGVALDYFDFLDAKLSQLSYRGRDIFRFNVRRSNNFSINVDPTSRYLPRFFGYWELIANWERVRQFTVDYLRGERPSGFSDEWIFDFKTCQKRWKRIQKLINLLEAIEELK